MDDQSQKDTDAGFMAWLLDNPDEMRIILGMQ
jgi:hypothetical protein